MTMEPAVGTVYRSVTKKGLKEARVKAQKGTDVRYTDTNDDGDFCFDDLEEGKWTFQARHKESMPSSPVSLNHPDDTKNIWFSLLRLEDETDRKQGLYFFSALLIAFFALIALYVALHMVIKREPVPLSATLPVTITRFQDQVAAAVEAKKTGQTTELPAAMADIRSDIETALEQRKDLSKTDRLIVAARVKAIEKALEEDKIEDVADRLGALQAIVKAPRPRTVGIWDRDPQRIFEVLLWGLAGILVNKIIITGWYLRRRTFYREGIIMHVAHIIATPMMVLVVVFLLSLVTLKITLAGGNELTLDLSDLRVMVAFSFLLGTIPWPLWNFIEGTAKRFPGGIS
jgi:hypothetical protein